MATSSGAIAIPDSCFTCGSDLTLAVPFFVVGASVDVMDIAELLTDAGGDVLVMTLVVTDGVVGIAVSRRR